MSDYKQEMSFDERCRQPLDAALQVQRNRWKSQPHTAEAVARFIELCKKYKKSKLDIPPESDILPVLKLDR